MDKIRVLLLSDRPLLGETLEHILGGLEDVELIIPPFDEGGLLASLPEWKPDVVLVTEEEKPSEQVSVAARILECYPSIPVVRVGLENNFVRLFTSRTLPARSVDLIDLIRHLPFSRLAGDQ